MATSGVSGEMMLFERAQGSEYECSIGHKSVMDIANAARCVPCEFINNRGNNVTDACVDYLKPLIAGEYPVIFKLYLFILYSLGVIP